MPGFIQPHSVLVAYKPSLAGNFLQGDGSFNHLLRSKSGSISPGLRGPPHGAEDAQDVAAGGAGGRDLGLDLLDPSAIGRWLDFFLPRTHGGNGTLVWGFDLQPLEGKKSNGPKLDLHLVWGFDLHWFGVCWFWFWTSF